MLWTHFTYGINSLLNLLFPQECAACGSLLLAREKTICLRCQFNLPKTGYHQMPANPVMDKFAGRLDVAKATSFLHFTQAGSVQELLHQLKYKNNRHLAVHLGYLFGLILDAGGWLKDIDAIVPVPLHRKKEYKRGYNQSVLIAEGIQAASGLKVYHRFLKRTKNTASQTYKNRMERWENVKDVFEVHQVLSDTECRLLLLDDVLTTGATLEACGRAILEAYPTARLSVATLAVAMNS